jgi:hypothetical protein
MGKIAHTRFPVTAMLYQLENGSSGRGASWSISSGQTFLTDLAETGYTISQHERNHKCDPVMLYKVSQDSNLSRTLAV